MVSDKPLIKRIYLDLDDVLVDFYGYALLALGISHEDMLNKLSIDRRWNTAEVLGISHDEFWEKLSAGGFNWNLVPDMPHTEAFVEYLKELKCEITILSTPRPESECYAGKINTIRRVMKDPDFVRFDLIVDKHRLASPESLLIDDSELNCLS